MPAKAQNGKKDDCPQLTAYCNQRNAGKPILQYLLALKHYFRFEKLTQITVNLQQRAL